MYWSSETISIANASSASVAVLRCLPSRGSRTDPGTMSGVCPIISISLLREGDVPAPAARGSGLSRCAIAHLCMTYGVVGECSRMGERIRLTNPQTANGSCHVPRTESVDQGASLVDYLL